MISTSGTLAVAITALALNYHGFKSIDRRIEIIEQDLKQFFQQLAALDKRVSRLEDKQ
jgi:hypothetical protein